ncbi:MAG: L-histidine N(alpha)-methyltransferase, partial [Xanthomonadales bacterium]|nr:L-histidine N(alpha)-methyltransferase [Xanthomonadales bacterium]
ILLGALSAVTNYVPMDVSAELLEATRSVVNLAYPEIRVVPLLADFGQELSLPSEVPSSRLGYFPGSTIGNFNPQGATEFLARARSLLGDKARMLVGADLVKPHHVLDQAYNDSEGVTERFNKNILARINRELDGDFDLDAFAHQAFFDEGMGRIEMHLVSLADQKARINGGPVFEFKAGETIHTESSHKFTLGGFRDMARQAGWHPVQHWTDDQQLFSIHLLSQR